MKYPYYVASCSKDINNIERSSSGGVFYEVASKIIYMGGAVYGAAFKDSKRVEHIRVDTIDDIELLRKSKYLMSKVNDTFYLVKKDLEAGKIVLYSGVGCQIAALYNVLGKDYTNLFTCEVVCHGAPDNRVFLKYIKEKEEDLTDELISINFRDKSIGWKENLITEYYKSGKYQSCMSTEHPVHLLYLKGINMQKGCAECRFASKKRIADLTLADYWQYEGSLAQYSNDQGISLVSVNTEKGDKLLKWAHDNLYIEIAKEDNALESCRHMTNPPILSSSYDSFVQLFTKYKFSFISDLFLKYGDVIPADKLTIIKKQEHYDIDEIFKNDTQEVVYIQDEEEHINGIITCGEYIKNNYRAELAVNKVFKYVILNENCIQDIDSIFSQNDKINRIPIFDENHKLCYEIRRFTGCNGKKDIRKYLFTFRKMISDNIKCFYFNRPDILEKKEYTQKQINRMNNSCSFTTMVENINDYKDELKDIFKSQYDPKYIQQLTKIPPIIKESGRYRHVDTMSKYINIIGGNRVTIGQPDGLVPKIHIYGRCGAFGYAVEDKDTMPSALQKLCNENGKNYKVINHGLWGAEDQYILNNLDLDIQNELIGKNDIVIIYMSFLPFLNELKAIPVRCIDTTKAFHDHLKEGDTFYDIPGHMTASGYRFIAKFIYEHVEKEIVEINDFPAKNKKINYKCEENNINLYVKKIKEILPYEIMRHEKVGSIVMNSNPFTYGHRFLVEEALKYVDRLLLFVLEEDKSFIKYVDRIEMVRLGTQDLKNVHVVPSGQFIISTYTFPEYFLKENNQNINIDVTDDIEIFGKYIAPNLHISTRFVGTEPTDNVTNQYNSALKKILPEYGIELIEIPRLMRGKDIISATQVRKGIQEKNYELLHNFLPKTSYEYIIKKYIKE